MKKFRIKNLTVAVDATKKARQACGINFSCPGGPAGSFCGGQVSLGCGRFVSVNCDRNTIACFTGTQGCFRFTIGCFVSNDGCGVNFSTIPPTDITRLVNEVEPVDRAGLVSVLKTDLGLALEQLEAAEATIEAEAAPSSLDEINEIEQNLEGALKEVKSMKKQLG